MSEEKCQRCGDDGPDLRTLWMACLYDMSEMGLPFAQREKFFYTLFVCKDCRSDWMQSIKHWFNKKPVIRTYVEREQWRVCDD